MIQITNFYSVGMQRYIKFINVFIILVDYFPLAVIISKCKHTILKLYQQKVCVVGRHHHLALSLSPAVQLHTQGKYK